MELNIGVNRRKFSARQLPNSHSGWDTFQARVVCKKCYLSDSIRWISKKVGDVQRNRILVYYDGNALLVSFQTLILVEIPSAARAICKKCHLSGSIRWIWLKLATFREIQYCPIDRDRQKITFTFLGKNSLCLQTKNNLQKLTSKKICRLFLSYLKTIFDFT